MTLLTCRVDLASMGKHHNRSGTDGAVESEIGFEQNYNKPPVPSWSSMSAGLPIRRELTMLSLVTSGAADVARKIAPQLSRRSGKERLC